MPEPVSPSIKSVVSVEAARSAYTQALTATGGESVDRNLVLMKLNSLQGAANVAVETPSGEAGAPPTEAGAPPSEAPAVPPNGAAE